MTRVISIRHLMENMSAKLFHLVADEVSLTACGRSETVYILNRRCYPYTRSGRNLSLSVGFSIQDEAMDVARSAPRRSHYHTDVIYLLP